SISDARSHAQCLATATGVGEIRMSSFSLKHVTLAAEAEAGRFVRFSFVRSSITFRVLQSNAEEAWFRERARSRQTLHTPQRKGRSRAQCRRLPSDAPRNLA